MPPIIQAERTHDVAVQPNIIRPIDTHTLKTFGGEGGCLMVLWLVPGRLYSSCDTGGVSLPASTLGGRGTLDCNWCVEIVVIYTL